MSVNLGNLIAGLLIAIIAMTGCGAGLPLPLSALFVLMLLCGIGMTFFFTMYAY